LSKYGLIAAKVKPELLSLYEKAVAKMAIDEVAEFSDKQEIEFAKNLAALLCLTEQESEMIRGKVRVDRVRQVIAEAVADDVLTRDEFEKIAKLVDNLRLNREAVVSLNPKFPILYFMYMLDTDPQSLHDEESGLILDSDEICIAGRSGNAMELYEWRKKRSTVMYAGPRYVIPSGIKGLTYRMGAFNVAAPSHDELTLTDYGQMKFTNKRFIFDGEKKNLSIKYKDLIKYQVGKDFVSFEKANGKDIVIRFRDCGAGDYKYPASSPIIFRAILEKYIGEAHE
jgi:hypothetical protein